jgi:hypothetical protein
LKLAALYIVWYDGIEILPFSIAQIEDLVDEVIIVYSNTSNYGQTYYYQDKLEGLGTLVNWEPDTRRPAVVNELDKRNYAIRVAKSMAFTHFVMLDCDEIYDQKEFEHDRDILGRSKNMDGLVCACKVYIREPTYQCDDHTLVPFIHRLTPQLQFKANNMTYPFAHDVEGHAHIDPTRRLNITQGVAMSGTTMHHFSHVRKDINLKMENSTARNNLRKSTLLQDYQNAKPGYYSQFYRDNIREVPNRFGIQI